MLLCRSPEALQTGFAPADGPKLSGDGVMGDCGGRLRHELHEELHALRPGGRGGPSHGVVLKGRGEPSRGLLGAAFKENADELVEVVENILR